MIFLIRFLKSLTKKDSVESAKNYIFLLVIQFSSQIRIRDFWIGSGFWPIRIRTQEKKSDPEKTRIRNTGFYAMSATFYCSYILLLVSP